jgi:hypothetical protein
MLQLTRQSVMSGIGGYRPAARSMLYGAGQLLQRETKLVSTAEIALSAFTFGVIQGRFQKQGGLTLAGLPVDLLSGAAFHVAALLPFARSYAHHLRAIGTGALSTYLATTGYRVGERWGSGAQKFLPAVMGAFVGDEAPVTGGASLADQELSNMVRAK